MTAEIAAYYAQPGTSLFDPGCATGTTLLYPDLAIDPAVRFISLDNTGEKLAKALIKINIFHSGREFKF